MAYSLFRSKWRAPSAAWFAGALNAATDAMRSSATTVSFLLHLALGSDLAGDCAD